jgi:hypothetical protein
MWCTLSEDLSKLYCFRRHKFNMKSFLCNTKYFYIVDSDTYEYFNNTEYVLLLSHCDNGYANAPQCYVIRTSTLPTSFCGTV